jgi:uracil-DNA glycosylase family 4
MTWDASQTAMLRAMGLPILTLRQKDDLAAPVEESTAVTLPDVYTPLEQDAPSSPSAQEPDFKLDHLDGGQLQTQAQNCQACGLCEARQQSVWGQGAAPARWLFVVDPPGLQEEKQAQALTGEAQQLFTHMLKSLRLDPQQDIFITPITKCRPPQDRNPQAIELALCLNYLKRQVALLQPQVIVVMGRWALQALIPEKQALGKLRAQVHAFEGIPTIVTYPPQYLLRNPADKAKAWTDLCLAAAQTSKIDA